MVETTTTALVKSELQDGVLFLPPGFRFHPTDAEVILSYLQQKFLNPSFTSLPIGEVDLNKCEPWDLPSKARMGEKEWYFFSHKDMKYPTGMRTNRATKEGYWKATGKDREIFKQLAATSYGGNNKNNKQLVGMKKTLVFYMGRAPKGTKTNWVMHEFRLHANLHNDHPNLRLNPKDEWVVCKVFHKKEDEAINKLKQQQQPQAAAVEYSAGTPNNGSSVEAGDDVGGDDFFQLDNIIDPSIYFSNSSANDILSTPPNMSNNNAVYSVSTSTTTASTSSFQQQPNYCSLINKSSSSSSNGSAPLQQHVSSWNNTPGGVHGIGSSYSLQHQAAMVKALGDVIAVPKFGTALPSGNQGLSSWLATAGVSQQNPLAVLPQHKIENNYGYPYIS